MRRREMRCSVSASGMQFFSILQAMGMMSRIRWIGVYVNLLMSALKSIFSTYHASLH